jgi:hypothetical protein
MFQCHFVHHKSRTQSPAAQLELHSEKPASNRLSYGPTGIYLMSSAVARFRAQVRSCGICDGQSGTGAGFLRVLRFPLPILIPPTASDSSSSVIRGWYKVADVPSGVSLTPLKKLKKKNLMSFNFLSMHYCHYILLLLLLLLPLILL